MSYRTLDNINASPYFDDFSDAKNFIQVLFKPGYPVQARELTQLQSILQNQISKMSDHVFKDGAVVYGGKVNVTNYGYLRVKTDSIKLNGGTVISPEPDFTNDAVCRSYFFKNLNGSASETNKVGTNFTPIIATKGVNNYTTRASISALADDFQIEIVDLIPKTATDDLILIYRFVKGSTEHIKNFTINVASGITLRLGEVSKTSSSATLSQSNSIDRGVINNSPIIFDIREKLYITAGNTQESNILVENIDDLLRVSITPGIVYKDGKFVNIPESNLILHNISETNTANDLNTEFTQSNEWRDLTQYNKIAANAGNIVGYGRYLFSFPTKSVGFTFVYTAVSSTGQNADLSLLDNASGFNNALAPGADRLKFNVNFTQNNVNLSAPVFADNYTELIRIRGGRLDKIKTGISNQYSEILKLFAKRTNDESGSYTVRPFVLDMKEHLKVNTFTMSLTNTDGAEVGDYVYSSYLNSDGGSSEILYLKANLIFESQDSQTGKFKPSSPAYDRYYIGEIYSVTGTDITIRQLTSQTWSNLPYQPSAATIWLKHADGDANEILGTLTNTPYYEDKSDGVYTRFDSPAGDSNKFVITANKGLAYVDGFEQETEVAVNISARKARGSDHIRTFNSRIIPTSENNIIVTGLTDLYTSLDTSGTILNSLISIDNTANILSFSPTLEGSASGTVIDFTPFEKDSLINILSSTKLFNTISSKNTETVVFILPDESIQ